MTLRDPATRKKFKTWVQQRKRITTKAASDVISRARRVERVLGKPLDRFVEQGLTFEEVADRLLRLIQKEEGAKPSSFNDLRRAIRLHMEFLQARPPT